MATGGIGGSGLGRGSPSLIPFAPTDFIFAAVGEELGLLGTTALLVSYLILVGTGLRAAVACADPFGKLLATGLSVLLGFQVFIVTGGVTRLIPLTGITMPFLSAGGSSLVSSYVLIAMLVSVSHNSAPDR
jgi:cell division protein FtsW (lipid II flippase)